METLVPKDHLARKVWAVIETVDTTSLEGRQHRRRRPPYHPRWLLALWVFASLTGLHSAEGLARALATDAALRWLAAGYKVSAPTLKRFRQKGFELFALANEQVLRAAHELGALDCSELAVDSLRLRADASTAAVRTTARSEQRLAELKSHDVSMESEAVQAQHSAKVAKHEAALAALATENRTNIVMTAPGAGLLKFPSGASAPGYRVTATAAGRSRRYICHVFLTADNCDYGLLERAVVGTREVLDRLEARPRQLTISADAGYHSEADLRFASENRDWADILIRERSATRRARPSKPTLFTREDFDFRADNTVVCPDGRQMVGPSIRASGEWTWRGDSCRTCAKKPMCTKSKGNRVVTLRPEFERARAEMRARMTQPDAAAKYGGRMAIIEPVFANISDAMAFSRCSSRHPSTVSAEILLKVLSHNVSRLLREPSLRTAWLVVSPAPDY